MFTISIQFRRELGKLRMGFQEISHGPDKGREPMHGFVMVDEVLKLGWYIDIDTEKTHSWLICARIVHKSCICCL